MWFLYSRLQNEPWFGLNRRTDRQRWILIHYNFSKYHALAIQKAVDETGWLIWSFCEESCTRTGASLISYVLRRRKAVNPSSLVSVWFTWNPQTFSPHSRALRLLFHNTTVYNNAPRLLSISIHRPCRDEWREVSESTLHRCRIHSDQNTLGGLITSDHTSRR